MLHAIRSFRATDLETGEVRMYRPGDQIDPRDMAEAKALGAAAPETKAMKPKENK